MEERTANKEDARGRWVHYIRVRCCIQRSGSCQDVRIEGGGAVDVCSINDRRTSFLTSVV